MARQRLEATRRRRARRSRAVIPQILAATFTPAGRRRAAALPACRCGARAGRQPARSRSAWTTPPDRTCASRSRATSRSNRSTSRAPSSCSPALTGNGQHRHRPPLDLGPRVGRRVRRCRSRCCSAAWSGWSPRTCCGDRWPSRSPQLAADHARQRRRPSDAAHRRPKRRNNELTELATNFDALADRLAEYERDMCTRAPLLGPADHRAHARARGAAAQGRGADALQGRVPRQHEPRDPHADERRAGHGRAARRHRARQAAAALRRLDARRRRDDDADHQRHPRRLEDRGRQDGPRARAVRRARARRAGRPALRRARPSARSSR